MKLDNGLKVLLISDPKSDKSAAAMDISAGAYHAPKDRAGLLHFLEHMLFLGTEKYPTAGEYNEYLKKNGGSSNAYTSTEDTNYFFDVKNDAFDEALDRFAQFFIAPTLDKEFVDREKNAVDSEYSLKIKEDARRIREASRQAINPSHPNSFFSVGNLDTLADRGDDKVYDALIKAYKRHYSAHRMSLVVSSDQSLEAMEKSVIAKFSAVPNNGLDKPELTSELLTENEKETRVHIEPLREMRTMSLTFPIMDTHQYAHQKPTRLVTHLLGHEGNHSLYQRLSKKGLIESLSAYTRDTDAYDALTVSMELTEEGLNKVDDVTKEIFAYIDLIKQEGITQERYQEMQNIASLNFAFQEKQSPMTTVYQLSPVLQNTPANNLLNINYELTQFNSKLTQKFLSQLTPNNMQQTIVAPGLSTNKNEPLYDVNYSVNKLPQSLIKRWKTASATEDMKLPSLNPFVAENIELRKSSSSNKPTLAIEKQGLKLWHYQDTSFNMPKSSVFMRIESPLAGDNVEHRAMLELARKMIDDKLNAFGYDAKAAGLGYGLFESNKGLGFSVNGYNDKQARLIETINKTIIDFDMSADKFELLKDSLLRDWKNAALDRPINQVYGRMSREFGDDPFSSAAKAKALTSVTFKQLNDYMDAMLSEVSLKVLVHGNSSKAEAMELGENLYANFLNSAKAGPEFKSQLRQLKRGELITTEMEIAHDDSAVVIAYPAQTSVKGMQQTRMIGQVLSAAFFNDLRTKQQLGYIVGARGSEVQNLPTLNFYVQSSKVGPKELERRIDDFISRQFDTIKAMTEEEFAQHKAGLLTNINRKDKNLVGRTSRLWGELADGFDSFDKREQLSRAIEEMKLADLHQAYESLLMADSNKRLISRNFGKAHQDKDYKVASKDNSVCRSDQCWNSGK